MIEEDTMNPMFNYWAVVERVQSLQAEADAAARRAAARRSRRRPALAMVGLRSGRAGNTVRSITLKTGEAL
jgi:hypothetical protein